jgi:hypothetical protein
MVLMQAIIFTQSKNIMQENRMLCSVKKIPIPLKSPALETDQPLSSYANSPLITKPPVPATISDNSMALVLSFFPNTTYDYVNGDGLDDLIVGAYGADAGNNLYSIKKYNAGKSYVVFGKKDTYSIE